MPEDRITVIKTAIKDEEDLDLLCNSLNAVAGRQKRLGNDDYIYTLRAQHAIEALRKLLDEERRNG